jgi:hypothetical protein
MTWNPFGELAERFGREIDVFSLEKVTKISSRSLCCKSLASQSKIADIGEV